MSTYGFEDDGGEDADQAAVVADLQRQLAEQQQRADELAQQLAQERQRPADGSGDDPASLRQRMMSTDDRAEFGHLFEQYRQAVTPAPAVRPAPDVQAMAAARARMMQTDDPKEFMALARQGGLISDQDGGY